MRAKRLFMGKVFAGGKVHVVHAYAPLHRSPKPASFAGFKHFACGGVVSNDPAVVQGHQLLEFVHAQGLHHIRRGDGGAMLGKQRAKAVDHAQHRGAGDEYLHTLTSLFLQEAGSN
jgi:hypothetical protein